MHEFEPCSTLCAAILVDLVLEAEGACLVEPCHRIFNVSGILFNLKHQ